MPIPSCATRATGPPPSMSMPVGIDSLPIVTVETSVRAIAS
jgi:hypothetical protein